MGEAEIAEENKRQWKSINALTAEVKVLTGTVAAQIATNATARVERVTAALDERRDEYVSKRDSAALPTTKAIYQAFIDAIDRIKEKLDEEE